MKYFIIVMVLVVNMYSEIYNENDTYIKDEKRYIKSTNQLLSGVLKVNEKITGVSTITEYKYKNGAPADLFGQSAGVIRTVLK
ncbi:hypothetical protein [Aliarcobacter butzleri]|uniref:hypothetical protein n=1 Tax=Aliarcobacter butzleri TaxID=28197 RepID=UPI0021B47E35|nr:hypothetical protein [Aliarcobacter butzleri]MCT7647675.1 hypothetical protein [Aliarcobacter butzleri]